MSNTDLAFELKKRIKIYPDFPKPGISFKDIFSVFTNPSLLNNIVDDICKQINQKFQGLKIDAVLGLDARGFLFAPLVAIKLNASFVPLRKKGKLPGVVKNQSYALEYGKEAIEIQTEALKDGDKVVIIDDLMATGGTMSAACSLVQSCKAKILECICVIELTELKGVKKLPQNIPFYSLVQYDS